MQDNSRHITLGQWLRQRFNAPVQKLPVDAGFTCPNRDGSRGTGGCSFCNNAAFTPRYSRGVSSVSEQLERGKTFFAHQAEGAVYLAYFQSYSNTYGSFQRVRALYEEALSARGVQGLVIGTRPDCVSGELLDYLQELAREKFVLVEYGVESTLDTTLLRINRGHDFDCARRAIMATAMRGIHVGVHLIMGLPGESEADMLGHIDAINRLPVSVLKLHQLQIIKDTPMARDYADKPWSTFSAQEYAALVTKALDLLRPDIVIDRLVTVSPPGMVVAPKWGLKADALRRLFPQIQ